MDTLRTGPNRVLLGPGGEFDLIRRLLGPEEALPEGILVGPGDDCVVLEGGLVVSTDLSVEGVHFRRDWVTLEEAGYRAAAAALSDLAAMTAEPLGALLSMAVDPARATVEAPELQKGVAEACRAQGVRILGGDLARSPGPLVLDVVVLGRSDSPVLRSGSEAGDEVWVTGWLGGSGGAVALLTEGVIPPDSLRNAFVRPQPRIREARWLASRAPLHGLIDLSDGLAGDSGHLAAASALALVLCEAWIPLLPEIRGLSARGHDPLHFALRGGEDYELCLTVPPRTLDEWVGPFQDSFGVPLTKVGWATEGKGVFLETIGGGVEPLKDLGFSHFSGEEEG